MEGEVNRNLQYDRLVCSASSPSKLLNIFIENEDEVNTRFLYKSFDDNEVLNKINLSLANLVSK